MKQFNEVIQVEISVDAIADQLLSAMDKEFKHKEAVVEVVIGNLLTANDIGMSQIFNTLNGYTIDINFEINDIVNCTKIVWCYEAEGKNFIEKREKIGACKVIGINLYSPDKLQVSYEKMDSNGITTIRKSWVSHLKCERISGKKFSISEKAFNKAKVK